MMKKRKLEPEKPTSTQFGNFNEDILHEVLRHVDARTLATAACVSKQWEKTAHDERLWEVICTRHWGTVEDVSQQLRSVVLALGGFRRLYSLCLCSLMKKKPHQSPAGSLTKNNNVAKMVQWGKDEMMYDAFGLRLHAGRLEEVMNQIIYELPSKHPLAESKPLRELLGYTPPQVLVSCLLGIITAVIGYLITLIA